MIDLINKTIIFYRTISYLIDRLSWFKKEVLSKDLYKNIIFSCIFS